MYGPIVSWSMSRTGISSTPASTSRFVISAGQLGAGLGEHQAGALVDEITREIAADQALAREIELRSAPAPRAA